MFMIGYALKGAILSIMVILPGLRGNTYDVKPQFSAVTQIPELTLENVYREILFQGIKHPEVVMRQVIWETQWLKCRNCSLKLNNLFGFTTRRGLMKFDNWVACIAYYKNWQDKLMDEEVTDYYAFLKKARFATAPNYNRRLKSLDIDHITGKFQITSRDWTYKFYSSF